MVDSNDYTIVPGKGDMKEIKPKFSSGVPFYELVSRRVRLANQEVPVQTESPVLLEVDASGMKAPLLLGRILPS